MKKNDLIFFIIIIAMVIPWFLFDAILEAYIQFNKNHGMVMSFIKFGLLATLGEIIGQRIKSGKYITKGFGILPKVIVWGFIGLSIKLAFVIFAYGTPEFLEYVGFSNATTLLQGDFSLNKLFVAFCISAAMNIIYAPVMMLFHKITDTHIASYQGKTNCLIKPIAFATILKNIDWNVQWNFVFKRTIPLFWIPAHTFTFMLPAEYRVLFAALLSIALGLILAIASMKSEK